MLRHRGPNQRQYPRRIVPALARSLPPEFGAPDGREAETVSYVVDAGDAPGTSEPSRYRVTCGGVAGFAAQQKRNCCNA